jgi:hypothetical protein
MRYLICAATLVAFTSPAIGQQTSAGHITATGTYNPVGVQPAVPAAQIAPITAPVTSNAILRAGTPVSLRLLQEVTTRKKGARVGQRINMEIAAPVEVNGVVVIPAGTPAWGEVTDVRNKGMWGKSGHLEARALYARVNGRQIRLTGTFDDKGVTGTAGVVAAAVFVPVVGFFVTGTSAKLPQGGTVNAFIDEDVELAIADAKPAPLQVTASVATVPAVARQTVRTTH